MASNQVVKSFQSAQSISAFSVVSMDTLPSTVLNWTNPSRIIGVASQNASTNGAVSIVIGGTVMVRANASISTGAIVGPVTATTGVVAARASIATTTSNMETVLGVSLEAGSTNSVIEVLLQIGNAPLIR